MSSPEVQQGAAAKGRKIDWGDLLPRLFTCAVAGLVGWIIVLCLAYLVLSDVLGWWSIMLRDERDPGPLHRLGGIILATVPIAGAILSAIATWRWWGNAR